MKRYSINIDSISVCKENLLQLIKEHPYFGIVDILIKIKGNSINFKMIDMNDDFVVKSFSNSYCYEPFFIKNWLEYLDITHGAILDIGASTGLYSLISQSYARYREVYAFEPYPRAYSRLIINKDINKFAKIKIFPYALSDYTATDSFSIKNFEGPITTAGRISSTQHLTTIPIIVKNIKDVIDINSQIGLIKIDTEGFEVHVLNTLSEIILKWRPVIFFECLTRENFEKIKLFFDNFNYTILGIIEDNKKLETISHFSKSCTNFIAYTEQHIITLK